MKKQEKPILKLHIQHELAYEIISISIIVILFGLAFLFATNLLAFNWFTVIFAILFILAIILKKSCQLIIHDNQLKIRYYKLSKTYEVDMSLITQMTFYQKKRQVSIVNLSGAEVFVYLGMKNKQKLLNYIVKYYPEIDCIVI